MNQMNQVHVYIHDYLTPVLVIKAAWSRIRAWSKFISQNKEIINYKFKFSCVPQKNKSHTGLSWNNDDTTLISGWSIYLNLVRDLQRNIENQKYQISVIFALFIHFYSIN